MTIDAWLKAACDDADARGLPELKPLLESLARSTAALREADRLVNRNATSTNHERRLDPPSGRRAARLRSGALSPVDLVRGCLDRIDASPT